MTNYSDYDQPSPPPQTPYLPLPLSKPFLTYALIGAIVIVWLIMEAAGGSQNTEVLRAFGANDGWQILQGETWRLFTSMFLHIGLMHLAFNGYALFIFGLEIERLYGPDRFITIYILSGLFGSLASFASRGPYVLSAGASGAIFGVIGMHLAFFMIHRQTFGQFGRQRMMNTLFIIGINLFFGFTIPGIDNLAHLGGLIAGFVMGYSLAPRYEVVDRYTLTPRVVDTVSLLKRWWVPALAIVILSGGVSLAISFWRGMMG
jgi:rhomboid protease GluP